MLIERALLLQLLRAPLGPHSLHALPTELPEEAPHPGRGGDERCALLRLEFGEALLAAALLLRRRRWWITFVFLRLWLRRGGFRRLLLQRPSGISCKPRLLLAASRGDGDAVDGELHAMGARDSRGLADVGPLPFAQATALRSRQASRCSRGHHLRYARWRMSGLLAKGRFDTWSAHHLV